MLQIAKTFQSKLTELQLKKVIEVSTLLGINPNWLLAVMYFETGKTFSTSKTNGIGSVGLIQFTRDKAGVNYKTIFGKKYNLSDIKIMTFNQQMDLVMLYYKEQIQVIKQKPLSFIDTYLITFFPQAVGKSSNYVLQTSGLSASLIAKQNPIFDKNKDNKITKQEIENFFSTWYDKIDFQVINQKKKV